MSGRRPEKPVLLIDSSYLGWSSFYAMGKLAYNGTQTGVMFGFLSALHKLSSEFRTNRFVFMWDHPVSYRKKLFPDYKKKRREEETEEEAAARAQVVKSLRLLRRRVLPSIGLVAHYRMKGFEADDLFAQYVRTGPGMMERCIIVSADADLYQLLDLPNVTQWNPRAGKMTTIASVREKYGIHPRKWGKMKSLAGCSTDNVPGVPGVREKTAIKWLKGAIMPTSKAAASIAGSKDIIARNRRLVVLPFEGMPQMKPKEETDAQFNIRAFRKMCRKYGFQSFLEGIADWEFMFTGKGDTRNAYTGTSSVFRKPKVR